MGLPPDENLPEVVPDQGPEVLSPYEAHLHQNQLDERYPKYVVSYDNAPKFAAEPVSAIEPSPMDTVAVPPFSSREGGVPWEPDASHHDPSIREKALSEVTSEKRKTIWGLRPGVFWALLIVLALVLIVGISGGIAGGIAASKAHSENAVSQPGSSTVTVEGAPNSSTPTSSSPSHGSLNEGSPTETSPSDSGPSQSSPNRDPPSKGSPSQSPAAQGEPSSDSPNQNPQKTKAPAATKSQAPSTPTAAAPAPTQTFLNNQTISNHGFAFQGFSDTNYQGKATKIIQDNGFLNLPFDCSSYVWLPGDTDCCITFCNSPTEAGGWWCDQRYRAQASGSFPRIWIGCGKDAHKEHACS